MREENYHRALEEFGEEMVDKVIEVVKEYGVDGAYKVLGDLEKYEQVACLELMYY